MPNHFSLFRFWLLVNRSRRLTQRERLELVQNHAQDGVKAIPRAIFGHRRRRVLKILLERPKRAMKRVVYAKLVVVVVCCYITFAAVDLHLNLRVRIHPDAVLELFPQPLLLLKNSRRLRITIAILIHPRSIAQTHEPAYQNQRPPFHPCLVRASPHAPLRERDQHSKRRQFALFPNRRLSQARLILIAPQQHVLRLRDRARLEHDLNRRENHPSAHRALARFNERQRVFEQPRQRRASARPVPIRRLHHLLPTAIPHHSDAPRLRFAHERHRGAVPRVFDAPRVVFVQSRIQSRRFVELRHRLARDFGRDGARAVSGEAQYRIFYRARATSEVGRRRGRHGARQ